ncbi:MAG: RsfS/YbeB/iojap family protein, partial [Planctomycetota bacterium]
TFEHEPFRSSRDTAGTWVVIDFIDLVAHLFEPSQREFYGLDELWSDGKPVHWQREDGEASG